MKKENNKVYFSVSRAATQYSQEKAEEYLSYLRDEGYIESVTRYTSRETMENDIKTSDIILMLIPEGKYITPNLDRITVGKGQFTELMYAVYYEKKVFLLTENSLERNQCALFIPTGHSVLDEDWQKHYYKFNNGQHANAFAAHVEFMESDRARMIETYASVKTAKYHTDFHRFVCFETETPPQTKVDSTLVSPPQSAIHLAVSTINVSTYPFMKF